MLYHLDMTIGNLIKKARKAKPLSLEALGEKIGVSRQLVWQWEKGDSDPRKHILALSKALEMPVEYFYGGAQAPMDLESKVKLLTPENRDFVETMADKFLASQQAEKSALPKAKK